MNVLITGATKGIGRAIAEKFASGGANLAVCARSEKDLLSLKSTLEKEHRISVHVRVCDMSVREQVRDFANDVKSNWKKLDVLVNNAGKFIPGNTIDGEEITMERLMNTNLFSAYYLTRDILPLMMAHKSGHIFNLCSVASLGAYPNGGYYSVSKFALLGYSRSLREELKDFGIRVTALNLGAVYTASWEGVDLPESRFIDSKDVASFVYATYQLSTRTVVEEVIIRPMMGDI